MVFSSKTFKKNRASPRRKHWKSTGRKTLRLRNYRGKKQRGGNLPYRGNPTSVGIYGKGVVASVLDWDDQIVTPA